MERCVKICILFLPFPAVNVRILLIFVNILATYQELSTLYQYACAIGNDPMILVLIHFMTNRIIKT